MRSPSEMDIIQIDVTQKCHLACSNCTRLVPHIAKPKDMDLDTFGKAVRSMDGWWKPGRVLGLIGGETTLHAKFDELLDLFSKLWNPTGSGQLTHGREPIRDFNAFATERLFDRGNGRGLWTSLGERFYRHYEKIMDVFSHWNTNTHEAGGFHQSGLIDRKELMDALGIPEHMWTMYRDSCWVQNTWSATVTPNGAYFCEQAAHLDMAFNEGKRAWPIKPGWWKRTPDQFGDQLDICEMCSLCLPGPSQVDSAEKDIVGKKHLERLIQIGSPAIKRGNYELYDPTVHTEKRLVQTKDSYVAGDRVSAGNASVRPRKTSCVVVCVGRAHHLASTIKHNKALVDEPLIVTSPEDYDTQEIASAAGVKLIISECCHQGAAAFNKGAIINDALATINRPDWIVLTDADVFLNPLLKGFMASRSLNPGVLYGTMRRDMHHGGVPSSLLFASSPSDPIGINSEPNGYFQLFHSGAKSLGGKWPHAVSEAFCSAGGVDSWFLQQFPADKRFVIPELAVVHINHASGLGDGWNGSKRRGVWRQTAMLHASGLIEIEPIPKAATKLKLTDTKFAHSVTFDLADSKLTPFMHTVIELKDGGFIFDGLPIGRHHIHVAYFRP